MCIIHEWIDREVSAFSPQYWGGELYLDENKVFNAAVHGGKIKKGNMLDMLNPFSRAWKNIRKVKAAGAVTESNLAGDGMTMGGVMIIDKNGEVTCTYPEKTFGDAPELNDLVEAAKAVSKES